MKILLHCCCAPCCVGVFEILKTKAIEPTIFWFNPNIQPYLEFKTRKQTLQTYASKLKLKFVDGGSYNLKKFILGLNNNFEFGKRCYYCYDVRLQETAMCAHLMGFEFFSTTLLASPWQNHELIKKLAEEAAGRFGLKFYYSDFRLNFKQSQEKARNMGLYMQKYCGCVFSEEERFCSRAKRELIKKLKTHD